MHRTPPMLASHLDIYLISIDILLITPFQIK